MPLFYLTYAQSLSADLVYALKTQFGKIEKVLYRGYDATNSTVYALDIITEGGKLDRVLFDISSKKVIFKDLSNSLKAEQMGIFLKAGKTTADAELIAKTPLVLKDGSNLASELTKFSKKSIALTDNLDLGNVFTKTMPDLSESIPTTNSAGFKVKVGDLEYRFNNPTLRYGYSEGYMRIAKLDSTGKIIGYLDKDGNLILNNALMGDNLAKTHFRFK